MKFWRSALTQHLALAVTVIFALAEVSVAGPIVDRVVANVNGHVVLQSDWEEEVAFEAFENGRSPDSFTTAERHAALNRLIDQELLREQVRPSSPLRPIRSRRGWPRSASFSRILRPKTSGMQLCDDMD